MTNQSNSYEKSQFFLFFLSSSPLFSVSSVLKILNCVFCALSFDSAVDLYSPMPRLTSSLSTIASETSFIDLRRWRLWR